MRNKQHFIKLLDDNPTAAVGFTLAAAAVYAARYGTCEPADHSATEFRAIARQLKSVYGENLTPEEVRAEMEKPEPDESTRTAQLPPARVTPDEYDTIRDAAERENESLSNFIRTAALDRAKR